MTITRLGNWDPHPSGVFPSQGIFPPDIPLAATPPAATPPQQGSEGQVLDQTFPGTSVATGGDSGDEGGTLRDSDGVETDVSTSCRCAIPAHNSQRHPAVAMPKYISSTKHFQQNHVRGNP